MRGERRLNRWGVVKKGIVIWCLVSIDVIKNFGVVVGEFGVGVKLDFIFGVRRYKGYSCCVGVILV